MRYPRLLSWDDPTNGGTACHPPSRASSSLTSLRCAPGNVRPNARNSSTRSMGLGLADPPPMLHLWQAMADYRPDPEILELGADFYDAVEPAKFPKAIPRFLNQRWAERVGLEVTDWEAHFCRFEPLPDNLPQPLALRYHGHQFRSYNPEIGDGRGFLFAQLRGEDGRLLDLGTKGSG